MNRFALLSITTLSVGLFAARDVRADCGSSGYCESQNNSGAGGGITTTVSSNSDSAVYATNNGTSSTVYLGNAINAETNTSTAIYAQVYQPTATSAAVYGTSYYIGVEGDASTGSGTGVYGRSTSGTGVQGFSSTGNGVYASNGLSATTDALKAVSFVGGHCAVYAENDGHGYGVYGNIAPAGSGYAIYGDNNSGSGYAGYFHGNVYATGSVTQNSDVRLKKNIASIDGALDRLLRLRGVTFEWADSDHQASHGIGKQTGFVAQEVEKVFPEWVGVDAKGYKTLAVGHEFEAILVESVRSLKEENDALRGQTSRLEDRIKVLETGRPILKAGLDGTAWGFGSLALGACALVLARRRREA